MNNLGHNKFKPFNSVINRVLNRRFMESTKRNAFEESKAWFINIARPAKIIGDEPDTTQIVSQCISITVA
jgi:hypothetical protein